MSTAVFEFIESHQSWLQTLVFQSTLILALGLLVGWLLGRVTASYESFVIRATIVALVAIPTLTIAMYSAGIESNLFAPNSFFAWATKPTVENSVPHELYKTPTEAVSIIDQSRPIVPENNTVPVPLQPSSAIEKTVATSIEMAEAIPDTAEAELWAPVNLMPVLVLVWSIVCIVQLLHLVRGVWKVRRAIANSQAAETQHQNLLDSLCETVSTKSVPMRKHPDVSSPCLCVIFRPVILVPIGCDYTDDELRSVLVHELGHVIRWDTLWQLASYIVRAVYCFNPLAWLLAFRHEVCADEVCDDLVSETGQDVRTYSLLLLSIAEKQQARRLATAGMIGMATIKSRLGRRIVRLTQDSRWRRFPAGRLFATTVSVVALMVSGIFAVASLPAADSQNDSLVESKPPKLLNFVDPDSTTENENKAKTADSEKSKPDEEGDIRQVVAVPAWINFSGKIDDGKGNPVAGARIRIGITYTSEYGEGIGFGTEVETQSDKQGKYKTLARREEVASEDLPLKHYLIVEAEGYDLTVAPFEFNGTPIVNRDVSLTRSTIQFERKVVDQYGTPWSRLSVLLKSVLLDDDQGTTIHGAFFNGGELETDQSGVLRIPGLPKFRKVTLEVKDSAVFERDPIVILKNRSGTKPLPISLNRSRPLYGFVVDHEQKPIKNAMVKYFSYFYLKEEFSTSSGTSAVGTTHTDSRGRFEIKELPPKGQFSCVLGVRPRATNARTLLPKILVVTSESTEEDVPVRIQVESGVLISGRVVDPHSKVGVRSIVRYSPTAENSNLETVPFECVPALRKITLQVVGEVSQAVYSMPTDLNGAYKLCVLPGPGVIWAYCRNHSNSYQLHQIPENLPTGPFNRYAHSSRQVEVTKDSDSQFDLTVAAGEQKTIKFTTANGEPVTLGDAVWNPGLVHVESDSISVWGFHNNQPITVMVRSKDKEWGKILEIHENSNSQQIVKMERTVTLSGVAKHKNGQPAAKSELGAYHIRPQRSGRIYTQPCTFRVWTDSKGRYEINVPFGEHYYVGFVRSPNFSFGTHDSVLKPGDDAILESPVTGPFRFGIDKNFGKWEIVGPF